MAERIDREELRALIREALKEALHGESPPSLRGRDRKGGKTQLPSPTPNPSPQAGGGRARTGALNLSSGVLTETKVRDAARTHGKIIVGANVAVTPLARDKARELKISIERQKP